MATSKQRLKNKIIEVMDECASETTNPQQSKESFADKLAEAVIFEIKNMTITATASGTTVTIVSIT